MKTIKRELIWDLPTRFFHFGLAGSVLLAYAFAQLSREGSSLFFLHIFFGLTAGVLLVWRLLWGLIGTRHARWSALRFSFAERLDYFLSILRGTGKYYAGHNPGSSLAIWAILGLSALTVLSGLLMGVGGGEFFEEVHEVAPNLLLGAVGFHVAGVWLASWMHQENYALSMVTGKKLAAPNEAIKSARPVAAALMLALIGAAVFFLAKGFDLNTGLLKIAGTSYTLQLGEQGHDDDD